MSPEARASVYTAHEPMVRRARQAMAIGLVALGLNGVSATLAEPVRAANNSPSADIQQPNVPQLAIGSEDDVALATGNRSVIQKSMQWSDRMGASVERIMIHPSILYRKSHKSQGQGNNSPPMAAYARVRAKGLNWGRYDMDVEAAIAMHHRIMLTAACDGIKTEPGYRRYITSVLRHYSWVQRETGELNFAPCNEPNYPNQVPALYGGSKAVTYRQFYIIAGQLINKLAPGTNEVFGELSSSYRPIQFLRKVTQCPSDSSVPCQPLTMKYYAYHPYQLSRGPRILSPIDKPGISRLDIVEQEEVREYKAGLIRTPDGQLPDITLNEFAEWAPLRQETHNPSIPARVKMLYRTDRQRSHDYQAVKDIVCNENTFARAAQAAELQPKIAWIVFYGRLTPEASWSGYWDPAVIKPNDKPTRAFRVIANFPRKDPGCVQPNYTFSVAHPAP